jgi:parallel beta-helix repeat protein
MNRRMLVRAVVFTLAMFLPSVVGGATFIPPADCTATTGTPISSTKYNACITAIAAAINAAANPLPASTKSALPTAGTPGRLYRVTDNIRGVWMDTGTQWEMLSTVVNVRDFGALGDGTTNDTVAIQSAVTVAGVSGGIVWFPPGTWIISAPVTLLSNVWLVGSPGAMIKSLTLVGGGTPPYSAAYINGSDIDNVRIINLHFEDYAEHVSNFFVVLRRSTRVQILNNKFKYGYFAVALQDCIDYLVQGNIFENSWDVALSTTANEADISGTTYSNGEGRIIGNSFKDALGNTGPSAGWITNQGGVQFIGNYVTRCGLSFEVGYASGEALSQPSVSNVVIANNYFLDNNGPTAIRDCVDCTVTGNVFRSTGTGHGHLAALRTDASGTYPTRVKISDNIFDRHGIYVAYGTNVSITNNIITAGYDATFEATLAVSGVTDLTISGNQVLNSEHTHGIYLVGNTDAHVTNNIVSGTVAGKKGIYSESNVRPVFTDNTLKDNPVGIDFVNTAQAVYMNNTVFSGNTTNIANTTGVTFGRGGIDAAHGTTTTVVSDPAVTADSVILITARTAITAALTGVFVDTLVAGTSFTLNHSDPGGANHGYWYYQILN